MQDVEGEIGNEWQEIIEQRGKNGIKMCECVCVACTCNESTTKTKNKTEN